MYIKLKSCSSIHIWHLTFFSTTAARISAVFCQIKCSSPGYAKFVKRIEVSNRCCLPSTLCSPCYHIPFKTTATTALPLVRTTLKPKVQGSNPSHDIFLLTTTFMCSCSCLGAPKAQSYATLHSLHVGQVHLLVCRMVFIVLLFI